MDDGSTAGKLLVASPDLVDPNFERSVIYVIDHDEGGAIGVILNRPAATDVREVLPALTAASAQPPVVFVGGPVSQQGIICMARARPGAQLDGFHPISGTLGRLDLESHLEGADPGVDELRLFAGYAGWGPGQLDGELIIDSWFIADVHPDDPLDRDPDTLWQRVLRRQGGRLARFAHAPTEPDLN
jgi:putative transcriptional regulator